MEMGLPSIKQIQTAKKYLDSQEPNVEDGRDAIEVIFKSKISLLEKVYALDKIYACNLMLTETGYRNLCKELEVEGFNKKIINVKERLDADKIVKSIAEIPYKDKKGDSRKGLLSENEQKKKYNNRTVGTVFASKYCYFTNPNPDGLFIIYDKFADIAINYLDGCHKPKQTYDGVEKYTEYTEKIRKVLDKTTEELREENPGYYRDLDKYLWLLGQVVDAKHELCKAGPEQKIQTKINYIMDCNHINLYTLETELFSRK